VEGDGVDFVAEGVEVVAGAVEVAQGLFARTENRDSLQNRPPTRTISQEPAPPSDLPGGKPETS